MRGWMLACDVVIWVGSLRRRHGHWLLWIWQFLIVWTVGGLTGSQSLASRARLTPVFTSLIHSWPREHVHIEPLVEPVRFYALQITGKEGTILNLRSFIFFLSLELGSCWASEKGGDFLLDKHVINLREHILSHRKITAGEMSGVVTQTALQIVVILNTCIINK